MTAPSTLLSDIDLPDEAMRAAWEGLDKNSDMRTAIRAFAAEHGIALATPSVAGEGE